MGRDERIQRWSIFKVSKFSCKKSLKYQMGNQKTDNTMTKRKRRKDCQASLMAPVTHVKHVVIIVINEEGCDLATTNRLLWWPSVTQNNDNHKIWKWWCLTPLSTTFQLYLVVSFIGGGNRRTCCKSLTNFIAQCCIEYTSPWVGFKLTTYLVVMGTDCIGRYKSNYHTITTAPFCSNMGINIFSRSKFIQWINAWNFEYILLFFKIHVPVKWYIFLYFAVWYHRSMTLLRRKVLISLTQMLR